MIGPEIFRNTLLLSVHIVDDAALAFKECFLFSLVLSSDFFSTACMLLDFLLSGFMVAAAEYAA